MRLAALTLLALAVVGCASRSRSTERLGPAAREAILLTRDNLAPGRHCEIVDADVALPAIASVIDTEAMPDYLRQVGAVAAGGYGLFSVRFDSTGKPVRGRLIEATFPDSLRAPMEQALASALLERRPGAPLAARVRIDLSPSPVYRIGKSEYCKAVPVPNVLSPLPPFSATGTAITQSVEKFDYELQVGAGGDVAAVHFISPIDQELDQQLQLWLMRQPWKPAIDDGLRVPSLVKKSLVMKKMLVRVSAAP